LSTLLVLSLEFVQVTASPILQPSSQLHRPVTLTFDLANLVVHRFAVPGVFFEEVFVRCLAGFVFSDQPRVEINGRLELLGQLLVCSDKIVDTSLENMLPSFLLSLWSADYWFFGHRVYPCGARYGVKSGIIQHM
jgi:hypothetical protein